MVATTAREENGEFCVAVAPATRTAGILTQLVKGAGCYIEPDIRRSRSYTGLIGFNPRRLKALKGDELLRNGPGVCAKSSSSYLGQVKPVSLGMIYPALV